MIAAVRAALEAAADPSRAPDQQRYMRSPMPYLGVTSPALTAALRPVLADPAYRVTDRAEWEATVRAMWDEATHREIRYAATALTGHRAYRSWQDAGTLPLYRHQVTTGAWWDHVDAIAARRVGPILAGDRPGVTPVVLRWAVEDDLWLRRTAIICQLQHKDGTDLGLLTAAVDANLVGSRFGDEFFIRKAIGWALRQHARVDPDWVRRFVQERGDRLSPLSRREALKHL